MKPQMLSYFFDRFKDNEAVLKLSRELGFKDINEVIEAYRDCPVPDWAAHDLVIRAIDCRAVTPTQAPSVIQEWREPSHKEFRARNLWSLTDAFTEAYKGQNPNLTLSRSEALHGLCDGVMGIGG